MIEHLEQQKNMEFSNVDEAKKELYAKNYHTT